MATTKKTTTTRKKPETKTVEKLEETAEEIQPKADELVEVVVNKAFNDKVSNTVHRKGERLEITKDRLAEITNKNATLVSVVETAEKQE